MAKHSTPRRRSGKHWVGTLLTAGAVVACMGLLLRFLPVGTIPTGGDEPSDSAVSSTEPAASSVPEPEPEPVVETLRFSATGDDLIHSPIYKQAARRPARASSTTLITAMHRSHPSMRSRTSTGSIRKRSAAMSWSPPPIPAFLPRETVPGRFTGPASGCSACQITTPTIRAQPGLAATLHFWESMPEDVVTTGLWRGADDYSRIPLQTVNGVTIAYLSYTEHTNGIPTSSSMPANVIYTSQTDVIEQQVRAAHQQADFVIVGVHWGVEDSHTIVDGQRTLAQQLADWGADVIVGTHPHVLQDAQWLSAADGRQTFVAYSLGNFLSTQNRPDQLVGAILNLQLQKTTEPDGTVQCAVLEPKLLPTVTHYDAGKSNVRTYLFRDYTQELAKQHGVRAKHSDFSLDTVQKIAQNNISSDFLELT